jgi:DNA-binding winged helix-turn-helix (wHTH) protein/TolB-like protein/Tfp pilus assembly protein PilF
MSNLYSFGEFRLDPARRRLTRAGEPVTLAPKALDILLFLVENRSRALTKEELLQQIWPDTFVEEGNLKFNISVIRKALGGESWIETLPRHGYRFAGEVSELPVEAVAVETRDRTEVKVSVEAELKAPAVRWRIAAMLLLALAVGAWLWWRGRPRTEIRSLAVLPFQSISAGANRDMELGLTDSLIGRLGAEGNWLIRPTASVRSFAGVDRDPVAAGRTLGVDAILDGSIQRSGDRIRLTLEVLRTSDGRHLWTGKFDEKLTDLFAMEDQIAAEVARALRAKLARAANRRAQSQNPEVYELYLVGRHYFYEEKVPGRQAIQTFEQAIQRDPSFAPAWAMLALSYFQLSQRAAAAPREVAGKMREAAAKAIELDESQAEGHIAMAFAKYWLDYDWAGGQRETRRALELNPNESFAYVAQAVDAIAHGRLDECERAYRKKLELEPQAPMSALMMSYPYMYGERYDDALAWILKAQQIDPKYAQTYRDLSNVYMLQGKHREAVEANLRARELSGASPERIAAKWRVFEQQGIEGFLRDNLAEMLDQNARAQYVSPVSVASIYTGLGEKEKALDWLEKACDEHTFQILWLKTFPLWKKLRGEPRYGKLLERLHLGDTPGVSH